LPAVHCLALNPPAVKVEAGTDVEATTGNMPVVAR